MSALIILPVAVLYRPRLIRLPLKTGLISDGALNTGNLSPSTALEMLAIAFFS
ncbi:MAG: hypothetical protein F6K45_27020 [Kamptonema sp. SIO1D9]|nr:hypothetical protein [Kamptonema sp. SIO1D9]